ncbi:MAG TPA: RNA-guided endonuclease TnpB family protein [Paenalcaligenes sp.]|nr:RNA-guided endonuclease TnpB family protein [Paenalcaligenes sp.]
MILAHKIALAPNNVQRTYLAQAAGTARFAYNWALAQWKKQYEAHQADNSLPKPSQYALRRQLNAIKREQFPWMLNVTKNAPQMAIIQLGEAFNNFFAGRAKYPVFRKKGIRDRFTITNDQFRVEGSRIRIPKLGWVRMREPLRFTGKIQSATISRVAHRWFVSIAVDTVDLSHLPKAENQGAVGVDLGVSALATLSTGETLIGPKPHKALLNRIRRLSRSLSRKQKGSANRKKAKARLAKLHARAANIRRDSLHKLTTRLTQHHSIIGIEDLNVSGMVKNRHLARAITDMGFFEFRRQLEYKAAMRGNQVVIIDRWYPSSKTCSTCGHKRETMPLSIRKWRCVHCDQHHDRDINAAINLKHMAVSSTVTACGEEGSGLRQPPQVKPASVKQEAIFKPI